MFLILVFRNLERIFDRNMKAQPLAEKLLDELTGFSQSSTLSEFNRHRYLRECDKAIQVEAAEGYMCKGIVYSLSNNFEKMKESFQIARQLDPSDSLIRDNFSISLANYGRFEDLKEILESQLEAPSDPVCEAFGRTVISIVDLELLQHLNENYANQIEQAIDEVGLNKSDVVDYIKLFNDLMKQKKVRFGVVPSISWLVVDGDIVVYYDFVGSAVETVSIMDEFNKLAASKGLRNVAKKFSLVLLPLGNS